MAVPTRHCHPALMTGCFARDGMQGCTPDISALIGPLGPTLSHWWNTQIIVYIIIGDYGPTLNVGVVDYQVKQ